MKKPGGPGIAFVVIGVVFIAIGSSGKYGFLGVGIAFLALGFAALRRQRRSGSV